MRVFEEFDAHAARRFHEHIAQAHAVRRGRHGGRLKDLSLHRCLQLFEDPLSTHAEDLREDEDAVCAVFGGELAADRRCTVALKPACGVEDREIALGDDFRHDLERADARSLLERVGEVRRDHLGVAVLEPLDADDDDVLAGEVRRLHGCGHETRGLQGTDGRHSGLLLMQAAAVGEALLFHELEEEAGSFLDGSFADSMVRMLGGQLLDCRQGILHPCVRFVVAEEVDESAVQGERTRAVEEYARFFAVLGADDGGHETGKAAADDCYVPLFHAFLPPLTLKESS